MRPVVALPAVAALAVLGADAPPPDVGLVERATSRLAQIDVSITGPPDVVDSLTKQDFELTVGRREIPDFTVDRVCRDEVADAPGAVSADARRIAAPAPARESTPGAPTFVFYLDHVHLTMAGRQNSLDTLRELIPKLITGGARGSILSSAKDLRTDVPLTTDPEALLAALDRIEPDLTRFDPWSVMEPGRIAEVVRALNDAGSDPNRAMRIAQRHAMDERWRAERDLRRIESVLATLADVPPPKAILYFADTLRRNAGAHYLSFFSKSGAEALGTPLAQIEADAATAGHPFDRVIEAAAGNGIRFYAIEGQGLAAPDLMVNVSAVPRSLPPGLNQQRLHDAQSTLASLALETGGEAFLNGPPPRRIAAHILDDLRCFYLLSFEPGDLPRDVALSVDVRVPRSRVTVRVRGRIVIPSESARLKARLLASLAAPELSESDVPIRVGVIPVGVRDGAFRARVQVAVAGIPVAGATWELGASLLSRGRVRADVSRRARISRPGTPVILEEEMAFGPGPFELVGLAHEARTDQISSTRFEGSFPDPREDSAGIGPISVLQPAEGAFLGDDGGKSGGSLVMAEGVPLRPEVPTAILGIVCIGRKTRGAIRVERSLVGSEETRFPEQTLDLGAEPCAQILDVVPENTLGPGRYRYLVRVLDGTGEIARGERSVVAGARGYPLPTP